MRCKALRYYAYETLSFLRSFPFGLISMVAEAAALWVLWPADTKMGLRIVDPVPQTRVVFLNAIAEALTLIEENDPVRFARLKREVRTIINLPVRTCAQYFRPLKTCRINLPLSPLSKDRQSTIVFLACILVHESTHGALCTKKILYHRNAGRVENFCAAEERRFARRLGIELRKDWGSPRRVAQ